MKRLAACALLISLGAAAAETPVEGMFELYARNRARKVPNYITADFLLLTHSMVAERTIVDFETNVAAPALIVLTKGLHKELAAQPDTAAARDFAAILAALASGEPMLASSQEAAAERSRIDKAEGIATSALFRQKIDYSQFRPRGHYTQSETLSRYFRAYRFASTVLFPALDSKATGISAADADFLASQAMALARTISGSPELQRTYAKLEGQLEFFFGPADDLVLSDLSAHLGSTPTEFRKAMFATGKRPRILGGVVETGLLETGRSARDVLTGFRLLPQRYSPDSAALGALSFPEAGAYRGSKKPFTLGVIAGQPVKAFPSALELMSLLGSAEAGKQLTAADAINYADYAKARQAAATSLDTGSGLAKQQLWLLRSWLTAHPASHRHLTSALAYWTLQKRSGVLYAKQSYTGVAKGFALPPRRPGSWIEPEPALYLELRHQADLIRRNSGPSEAIDGWIAALDQCIEAARAARHAGRISPAQEDFLNGLDTELARLTGKPDRPAVTDVHTEPNSGQVVQEGVGFPAELTAAGKTAVGAVFTHFEFKQPMADRLTDEKWLARLRTGEFTAAPKPAAATKSTRATKRPRRKQK